MVRCAIVGATGLVGSTFLKVLEQKKLNIDEYVLLASSKSEGKKISFMGKEFIVETLNSNSFDNGRFKYALFSAGSTVSKYYAPIAAKNGCIVIDNSSEFRMKEDVPLVVPEVNCEDIFLHKNIIANPNCSTIQAVIPLKVLNDNYKIKRIVYSTYQAVSGAGILGIEDLEDSNNWKIPKKFPYTIHENCIPHIDVFLNNGYTKEEEKMINETKKILHDDTLKITATCVRVPVKNCHSESINVELEKDFDLDNLKQQLNLFENLVVLDNTKNNIYPFPKFCDGKDEVFIGRIRRDESVKYGLNFWCVADNIRKGAATNAVQILEKLIEKENTCT